VLDIKTKEGHDIRYALEWALNELKAAQIATSIKQAELLLSNILHCDFAELYLESDMILEPDVLKKFKDLIRSRCKGFPVQYLMQETCFYGLKLCVEKGVFIPRPETEVLVEKIIDLVQKK